MTRVWVSEPNGAVGGDAPIPESRTFIALESRIVIQSRDRMLAGPQGLSLGLLCVTRTLRATFPPDQATLDITAQAEELLPDLNLAIVNLKIVKHPHAKLTLLDPRNLHTAPTNIFLPTHKRAHRISVGAKRAAFLLPPTVRILAIRPDGTTTNGDPIQLSMSVEVAEELEQSFDCLTSDAQLARSALLGSLAEAGVSPADAAKLEEAPDAGSASPAQRVFSSFVSKRGRTEDTKSGKKTGDDMTTAKLLTSARRAAHHIAHLQRGERVAQATYFRNCDAPPLSGPRRRDALPLKFVLDNVRSAYNVGSIFRTADTARLAEVITCGFTPHPPHPGLAKTGFSALDHVPTRHFESTLSAISTLREEGFHVAAMETTEQSQNYVSSTYPLAGVALVLGNEEVGVDTYVLQSCDSAIEIPCLGRKNSLNVASAASVVAYEIIRQWGALDQK